ncbi:ATP-dependent zinc metalloprotease FtsH [anaerobic digester metagenome]
MSADAANAPIVTGAVSDEALLRLVEVVLTAEVYNQHPNLDLNDLPPSSREVFGVGGASEAKRPVAVSEAMLRKVFGVSDAAERLKKNPFVSYEEFGQRLRVTALAEAARWFARKGGAPLVRDNPALAYYYEQHDPVEGASYADARRRNPKYEETKAYLERRISALLAEDERMRSALELCIISAPEEIRKRLDDLVLTSEQYTSIEKVRTALENLAFLREHDIAEVGKFLFVGPPGTGKTSLALAMSHVLGMPIIEVRISMITSQYLGETSKNIDRVFDFARRLAPAILFVDEFDFVAKSRVTDDHGAMKRAVNALLKNIDQVSLIRTSVVLIGATNHPRLLDEAAWRRFDEVIEFSLPDREMRLEILNKVMAGLDTDADLDRLADETEGFSGADLRMIVKEGVLSALMEDRTRIFQSDIEKGVNLVLKRNVIKDHTWV